MLARFTKGAALGQSESIAELAIITIISRCQRLRLRSHDPQRLSVLYAVRQRTAKGTLPAAALAIYLHSHLGSRSVSLQI